MAFYNATQPQVSYVQPQYGPPSFGPLQTYTPPPVTTPPSFSHSQPTSSFVWVQGEAGAKAYPVAAGNRVALFDSEDPVLYVKATDLNGRPLEMEVYDLVKRESPKPVLSESPTVDLSKYITRDELSELIASSTREEVERAISEMSLKPAPKRRKGDDE